MLDNIPFTAPETHMWINFDGVRSITPGSSVVLFGAGQGSVDFITANKLFAKPFHIVAIVDNDSTMWGKNLCNIDIFSPDTLGAYRNTVILVTTISGKEHVSKQLESMGYNKERDFFTVGHYPDASLQNLKTFLEYNEVYSIANFGDTILHVGPGGFLGLECCLYALGYSVISMDANSFGINYPDVTNQIHEYHNILNDMLHLPLTGIDKAATKTRFLSLFHEENNHYYIDTKAIPYHYPFCFSSVPLQDSRVHAVLSFAVLEHVLNPEKVVREIKRVLKPNGTSFQKIITRDHRSFSKISGYHPFSYLCHSETEWEEINKNKFYQNRLLLHDWEELFEKHLDVTLMKPLDEYTLSENDYQSILKHRPELQQTHLHCLNCMLIAVKYAEKQ